MLIGVEGDVVYGARTKYEWLAIIEDIDRGVKVGLIKQRPKSRRFRCALRPGVPPASVLAIPTSRSLSDLSHTRVGVQLPGRLRGGGLRLGHQEGCARLFPALFTTPSLPFGVCL